jgi:hypothetical protein
MLKSSSLCLYSSNLGTFWLKIEFELYKHNDELFNIYYGIFYELGTFAYFDRLCKLEKRGDEIKKKYSPLKLLSQSQPNFAEMILRWSPFKLCLSAPSCIHDDHHYEK